MSKKILISLGVLFIIGLIGCSKDIATETDSLMTETESEASVLSKIEALQKEVSALLTQDKKFLVSTIYQEQIDVAKAKIDAFKDLSKKESDLLARVKEEITLIDKMFTFQKKVSSLIKNDIIVNDAKETFETIIALLEDIKPLKPEFVAEFEETIQKATAQFDTIEIAQKAIHALFGNKEHTTIKKDLTQKEIDAAKVLADGIANTQARDELLRLLSTAQMQTNAQKPNETTETETDVVNAETEAPTEVPTEAPTQPPTQPTTSAHVHNWIPIYNHNLEDHGTEEIVTIADEWTEVIFSDIPTITCGCGAVFSSLIALNDHQHSFLNAGDFSHPSNYGVVYNPVGTIFHPAITETRWVPNWVSVKTQIGEECSSCGVRR